MAEDTVYDDAAARAAVDRDEQQRAAIRDNRRRVGRRAARPVARAARPHASYRGLIIAEFVASLIMVALQPFLAGKNDYENNPYTGQHVTFAKPFVRASALCLVFFVLGLAASGPRSGKVAAAFGGLITLSIVLTSSGEFIGIDSLMSRSSASGSGSGSGVQVE